MNGNKYLDSCKDSKANSSLCGIMPEHTCSAATLTIWCACDNGVCGFVLIWIVQY